MNSSEILEQVLRQETGLPVKHYEYSGIKKEYIVYNEEVEQLTNYGDNAPQDQVTWWQVHIFSPKDADFRSHKKKTVKALQAAGFTVTDIAIRYEKETKTIHVVISCHVGERED